MRDVNKPRKPELPPAVAARKEKRTFIVLGIVATETSLDRFLAAVKAGETPNQDDMRIVAAQLNHVLAGEPFRKAFGLQRGRGRKESKSFAWRNQHINAEIEELRDEGWTLDEAAELVAQRYSVSSELAKKVHKQSVGLTRNKHWGDRHRPMRVKK